MASRDKATTINDPYLEVPTDEAENRENDKVQKYGLGVRHVQALLLFCYLVITFIARGHLGVTIVAMVDPPVEHNNNIIDNAVKNVVQSLSNNRAIHFFNADGKLIDQLYTKIDNISMDDITIDIQNNTVRPTLFSKVNKKTRTVKYNAPTNDKTTNFTFNVKKIEALLSDKKKIFPVMPDLKKSVVHIVNNNKNRSYNYYPKDTSKKSVALVQFTKMNKSMTTSNSMTTDRNKNKIMSNRRLNTLEPVNNTKAPYSPAYKKNTIGAYTDYITKLITPKKTTEVYKIYDKKGNTIYSTIMPVNEFTRKKLNMKTAYIGFEKLTDKPRKKRSLPSNVSLKNPDQEKRNGNVNEHSSSIFRIYSWRKSEQETIQGAFFLGYFLLMLPMGMICQRYGGKIPMQISLFINGVVSLIAPWVISWGGWQAACVCRVIQGLAQTGTYPATISMCAAWIPQSERSSLSTYIFSGTVIGTVIAFQVGGFLATTAGGWPSIFWFSGILCLLGFIFITIFTSATPQENKFITEEELAFIRGNTKTTSVKKTKVPWRAAFSSKHVWAIFATHVGSGVSFFFLFTQVPSYLHYILGFNVKESGLLSSLPYIANFFASLLFGFLADFCCNRNYISVKVTRIIYNSIACFGMAFSMVLVSFLNSPLLGVSCFILALFSHAGVHVGWMVNYIDICPNYSSSLVAVGNTLMNVVMIIIPMVVSKVVTDVYSVGQWRTMLFIVSLMTTVCNVIFVCFMSTDVQPWNNSYQLAEQTQENNTSRTEARTNEK